MFRLQAADTIATGVGILFRVLQEHIDKLDSSQEFET